MFEPQNPDIFRGGNIKKLFLGISYKWMNNFLIAALFFIINTSSLSFASEDSSSAPAGYIPQGISESLAIQQNAGAQGADILLIQSALPWDSSANTRVLDQLNYTYDVVDMTDIPTTDIEDYQVVLIVNDQNQAFYDRYAEEYTKFEEYVESGGVLVFFACDQGWAGGDNLTDLPGNVKVSDNYESYNLVANASHEIVTQILTEGLSIDYRDGALIDSDLNGNYASHNSFPEPLPEGANVLLKEKDGGDATLMIYPLGSGHVIASGLTWEFTYDRYNGVGNQYGFGRALPDLFQYAFSLAGGYERDDVSVTTYPEDQYAKEGRKTLWKHPGDIIDVVARIENNSGEDQSVVKLEFDTSNSRVDMDQEIHVYRRANPRATSLGTDLIKLVEGVDYYDFRVVANKVTINNLDVAEGQIEYVLRYKIDDLQQSIDIDVKAAITSETVNSSSRISDGGNVVLTTGGKIILTNRSVFYEYFGGDNYSFGRIEALWSTLYDVAEKSHAVIYYVDKYDLDYDYFDPENPGVSDPNNPTVTWLQDRESLPYDADVTTALEEAAINLASSKIAAIERHIIDSSGGNGSGRYVAILGGDEIIPFYRAYDDTGTVLNTSDSAGTVTELDTSNGYMLTDGRYRVSTDADNWKGGSYGDDVVAVGRIVAGTPLDSPGAPLHNRPATVLYSYRDVLLSSNGIVGKSENIIKLENLCRDGELDNYEARAGQGGQYNVIKSINGVTLDTIPPEGDYVSQGCGDGTNDTPDDASGDLLQNVFLGSSDNFDDFAVMRFMTHGSVTGIQSSEPTYESYITANKLRNLDYPLVKSALSEVNPVYILDACLVGQVENKNNGFLNQLNRTFIGGVFASSTVTITSIGGTADISGFNDIITNKLFDGKSTGEALVDSMSEFVSTSNFERMQMNLFGLPWAKLEPRADLNAAGQDLQSFNVPDLNKAMKIASVQDEAGEILSKKITIDTSSYLVEKAGEYDIISIDSYESTINAASIPVLPLKRYRLQIPANATNISVVLNDTEEASLGVLKIPGMKPPAPTPDWLDQESGYVDLQGVTGVYPESNFNYKVMDMKNSKVVNIDFVPVTYNVDTGQTDILTAGSITLQYSTTNRGVADNLNIDKYEYTPSSTGQAFAEIENTSADVATFSLSVNVYDLAGNVVSQSGPETEQVSSGETVRAAINFTAPAARGVYRVEVIISDGFSNIATSSTDIAVIDKAITEVIIPASLEKGVVTNISVTVANYSVSDIDGFLKIDIYDSNQSLIARLPQKNTAVIANSEATEVFPWVVDVNLEAGDYFVKAILSPSNESALSKNSDDFAIAGEIVNGDANGDGEVDVLDVITLINIVFNGQDDLNEGSDANGDGTVNVLDIIWSINKVFPK